MTDYCDLEEYEDMEDYKHIFLDPEQGIFEAVTREDINLLSCLLSLGLVNPNHQNEDLDTPLHVATRHDNHKATKILLNAGADSNIKNLKGDTPLMIAISKKNDEIIELFKQKEAESKN